MEDEITRIRSEDGFSRSDQLIRVMTIIIEKFEENRQLLSVVLKYLSYLSKGERDPDYRVRRRTVRLRHILNAMLIEGIRTGEFARVNVKEANELLYGFLEAAVFRLSILQRPKVDELKKAMVMTIHQFESR